MTAAPSLRVRTARRSDLRVLVDFQLAMALETEQLQLDAPTVKRGVAEVFKRPELGCYYVVEHNETVIASLLTTYEWSDWRCGQVIWLQSVYVMPEWRRKGIFRLMYAWIRDRVLAEPGYRGIRLYVERNNRSAQAVYRNMGMEDHHYQMWEWMKR